MKLHICVLLALIPILSTGAEPSTLAQVIENEEMAPAMKNKTGTKNGVRTDQINTSHTKAPTTDKEVIDGTTLSNKGLSRDAIQKGERQAEEEGREFKKIRRPQLP